MKRFIVVRTGGYRCRDVVDAHYLTQAHAFYDGNKRTALIASLAFLDLNGWDLKYPMDIGGKTAVADVIERCADGKVTKDEMIDWFDRHKAKASQ